MTITQDNYLDVPNLLINELFGDVTLFILFGLIGITWWCVKNRVPSNVIVAIDVLFVAAVISYAYNAFIWAIVLFILGILVYGIYHRIYNR